MPTREAVARRSGLSATPEEKAAAAQQENDHEDDENCVGVHKPVMLAEHLRRIEPLVGTRAGSVQLRQFHRLHRADPDSRASIESGSPLGPFGYVQHVGPQHAAAVAAGFWARINALMNRPSIFDNRASSSPAASRNPLASSAR